MVFCSLSRISPCVDGWIRCRGGRIRVSRRSRVAIGRVLGLPARCRCARRASALRRGVGCRSLCTRASVRARGVCVSGAQMRTLTPMRRAPPQEQVEQGLRVWNDRGIGVPCIRTARFRFSRGMRIGLP
ncbi:hypothetical protein M758_2G046600 [Ceratodon purpureus]|nr:hypothetical protein M758_2G046600 [Ceratodon purpureus]